MVKALLVVVAIAGLVAGCGSSSKKTGDATTTTSAIGGSTVSTTANGGTTPLATTPPLTGAIQTTPTTTTATTTAGPVVTSISGPPAVNVCSNAPNVTTPTEATLKWTTAGATSVNIAIDSESGVYKSGLPASGETSVPLPCAGNNNTYFVIALGPGGTRAVKSLTTEGRS